jgi:hypothetical protein
MNRLIWRILYIVYWCDGGAMGSKLPRPAGIVCVVAGILVVCAPEAARAQLIDQYLNTNIPGYNVEPGVTVTSRLRPEYDYPGIRLGDIVLTPELAEGVGFDSNAAGSQSAKSSSFLETLGTMKAASDWLGNSFNAAVTVDNDRYFDLPRQSYTNWTGEVAGTHEFGRDVLSASYAHLNLNQTPIDLDVPQVDTPIPYQIDDVHTTYNAKFNALGLQPGLELTSYRYQNGTVLGVPYQQTYRNRLIFTPSLTVSYELAPLRNLLLVLSDSDAHYTDQPAGLATRNFNDKLALAGIDYDTGGPIRLRALAGYELRNFSSSQYPTISSPVAEASAIWTATGLTTVTGTVAHYIEDSASETTVGLTSTAVKLAVDHEYLRNVLLNGAAAFIANSYQQNQGNQSYLQLTVGVTWLINQNMRLAGRYDYSTRQSSVPNGGLGAGQTVGGNYSDNRFLIQLRIGL